MQTLDLNDPEILHERPQTLGEEIANRVSHCVGLLAALIAFPFLVWSALQHGGPASVVGASVFAATLVAAVVALYGLASGAMSI